MITTGEVQLSLVIALVLGLGYVVSVGVYRLFFHPLAKFPGPRLAGLTFWYNLYYDVILKGQFTFHIQDLHKKYGPIVRVTPDEVHIRDPEFFDEFYNKQGRLDRDPRILPFLGNDTAIFATTPSDLHKIRRAPIAPLFSRKRILELEPIIKDKIAELVTILHRFQANGQVLSLNKAYMTLTEDIIYQYCFGKNKGKLSTPDFRDSLDESFRTTIKAGYLSIYFPWFPKIIMSLPINILTKISPPFSILFDIRSDIMSMVDDVQSGRDKEDTTMNIHNDHASVIREMSNSHLPAFERTLLRITDEAANILAAGVTTSGWTATVASYYIISQPRIFNTLREELRSNFPDLDVIPDLVKLEKLKYLHACVKEGLRMGIGESWRSPRIPRQDAVRYKDWVIPKNSVISMSKYDITHDERVFVTPQQFIPERWLDYNKHNAGVNPNDYLIVFGKGTRACLGRELAYAELFHMLAAVFRSFEFELYETDESDVTMAHDYLIPLPKFDTQGVRVKVKA